MRYRIDGPTGISGPEQARLIKLGFKVCITDTGVWLVKYD